ncbi:hypothetical protein JCM13580A_13720 [Streptomyces drozdowiczii]
MPSARWRCPPPCPENVEASASRRFGVYLGSGRASGPFTGRAQTSRRVPRAVAAELVPA